MKSNTYQYKIPDFFRQLILAWLFAVTIENGILSPELRNLTVLDGIVQMSFGRLMNVTVLITVLLFGISRKWNTIRVERAAILAAFCVLTMMFLRSSYTKGFLDGCLIILVGFVFYVLKGGNLSIPTVHNKTEEKKVYFWITIAATCVVFVLISIWTAARIYTFSTPTYDFGIFSQMFYNMKETGLPMTTLERDGLLSHFHVHVSPIYYLMLPFYMLFPEPVTLQVLQAAVMTLAVIPLWKIAKHHGLSDMQSMLCCLILLLYPAFSGGAGYDIHENCFLTVMILWLFYGLDKENIFIILPAAVLTLMVKEDAAVYVAVAALWFLVKNLISRENGRTKNIIIGTGMFFAAILWFFLVTGFLAEIGDGVMTYRYNNFIYDGSGSLITVIKAVILNPMKAVFECMDAEKHRYIILTMFPILGLPFLTRRYERYILLIPYVLVNLMTDYPYQHEIFFQYNFGTVAFLIYLCVINIGDWKKDKLRSHVLIISVMLCAACFTVTVLPRVESYVARAVRYKEYYGNVRSVLSTIPDDASVTATTFYTTVLSERPVLYDVRYSSTEHLLETEYVALDVRQTGDYRKYETEGQENGYENLRNLLVENDYELFETMDGILEIYKRR